MRVLVTGGAGFIGSTVVDRMLAHGHEVFVLDDLSSGKLANLEEARREGSVHLQRMDIRSDAVPAYIDRSRPDVVCHLAAQPGIPVSVADPMLDASANIIGLLNVLIASAASGVRKVVFAASGGAMYGTQAKFPVEETARGIPASPYAITKRAGDDYLRVFKNERGLDFTSLALANVYGPRQDPHGEAGVVAIFSQKLLRGEAPTIYGTGNDTRDYVYVDDVAHAFVLALDKGSGETFNIGTGIETSTLMIYKMLAAAAGYEGEPIFGPPRAGDLPRNSIDPTKAEMGLGWKPWTPLAEGLRQTILSFAGEI
jgi:UDP-glucose 4-epimerase